MISLSTTLSNEPDLSYLETCYQMNQKPRQSITLNKIPKEELDNHSYYFISQLRIGAIWPNSILSEGVIPIDLIRRLKVFINDIPVNIIHRDEILISSSESDPTGSEMVIPLDLTGFTISRSDPEIVKLELELDRNLIKATSELYIVVQLAGTHYTPDRPMGYLQRGIVGSFHVNNNSWLDLSLTGLIVKVHFVSKVPFDINGVKHDEYAFMAQCTHHKIDDDRYWCSVSYDTLFNFKRFKRNSFHTVFETDTETDVTVYIERVAHNFNGNWGLEQIVERSQ